MESLPHACEAHALTMEVVRSSGLKATTRLGSAGSLAWSAPVSLAPSAAPAVLTGVRGARGCNAVYSMSCTSACTWAASRPAAVQPDISLPRAWSGPGWAAPCCAVHSRHQLQRRAIRDSSSVRNKAQHGGSC